MVLDMQCPRWYLKPHKGKATYKVIFPELSSTNGTRLSKQGRFISKAVLFKAIPYRSCTI